MPNAALTRVLEQLALYEHPLLLFTAREKGDGVEVLIGFKDPAADLPVYAFEVHPRDLQAAQFPWQFQRQLYDALHDYFIEMFTRTPQSLEHRRGEK